MKSILSKLKFMSTSTNKKCRKSSSYFSETSNEFRVSYSFNGLTCISFDCPYTHPIWNLRTNSIRAIFYFFASFSGYNHIYICKRIFSQTSGKRSIRNCKTISQKILLIRPLRMILYRRYFFDSWKCNPNSEKWKTFVHISIPSLGTYAMNTIEKRWSPHRLYHTRKEHTTIPSLQIERRRTGSI